MKRASVLMIVCLSLLLTVAFTAPVAAQAEFNCPDGTGIVITNGVEFDVNVRPGEYRATVIGLNGFDPVLAVINLTANTAACNDDATGAASYAAELPTTGPVSASGLNSQLNFRNNGSDFADFALLVGGFGGAGGEFIMVFEGMQVTTADGIGDPFAINFSPNLVASGVGIHAYVIHVEPSLDPLLAVVDGDNNVMEIGMGPVYCDDASNADLCWRADESLPAVSLEGYGIAASSNSAAVADAYDPFISVPTELLDPTLPYDSAFINYIVSSYKDQQNNQSTGAYIFAIHTGIGVPGQTPSGSQGGPSSQGGPGSQSQSGSQGGPSSQGSPSSQGQTVADAIPIDCTVTGQAIEGDVGSYINLQCPAGCTSGGVWGTGIYSDDSSICTAAIHAGMMSASGGQISVTLAEGMPNYVGSTANGITSGEWGAWERSIIPGPVIVDGATSSPSGNSGSPSGNTGNSGNTGGQSSGSGVTTQSIAYGDSGTAQISNSDGDAYAFTAAARDVITIEVNADDFDPLVILMDGNGREISRDDDSGPGFNSLISNLRIPTAGTYIILVTSFSGSVDVGSSYEISLSGG